MAVRSMQYDHQAYTTPLPIGGFEAGGAASTAYGKFAAFTAMIAKSAQITLTVIGTNATASFNIIKVTGIATTTLATTTVGTTTVGATTNLTLGNTTVIQGDIIQTVTGTVDTASKAAVTYELLVVPGANVTA
jgi:hypothetical protein